MDALERGTGGRSNSSLKISSSHSYLGRWSRMFRSQGAFTLALLFSLFVLMSLVAVTYVQTGGGPSKSSFGCDLLMSPPHASERNVMHSLCEAHSPLVQINKDLHDKIITQSFVHSIRFLVVGDWGRDGFCCQRDVAYEMARAAGTVQPQFVANAGDAFYEAGLESEMEEQVETSWKNVYQVHDTLKELPWYSVLGNHEYRGSVPAVLRVPQRFPLFRIHDRFYDQVFTSLDGQFTMHMFFLDTSPMIAAYKQSGYDDPKDPMLNQPEGIRTQWDRVDEQLNWLDSGLNSSSADIKVVMGHHPAYTSGSHYHEDDLFIRKRVGSILEKNNVLAYFSGHDHNLQEYWRLYSPTHYIVTAGGSKVEGAFTQSDSYLRYFDQVNGFCSVEASEQGLKIAFVDYVGNVIRTVDVLKQASKGTVS